MGIFSNQLNKNDIQPVYNSFLLAKTMKNGFIIYFSFKKKRLLGGKKIHDELT